LALQAASSDTSTSTTAKLQASYAIVPDFFNGLLVGRGAVKHRSSIVFEYKPVTHERSAAANSSCKRRAGFVVLGIPIKSGPAPYFGEVC
jgi:hypothetical protein